MVEINKNVFCLYLNFKTVAVVAYKDTVDDAWSSIIFDRSIFLIQRKITALKVGVFQFVDQDNTILVLKFCFLVFKLFKADFEATLLTVRELPLVSAIFETSGPFFKRYILSPC